MNDPLRDAVQQILDRAGDGWTVAHYVIAMGLERVRPDGSVESAFWPYSAPGQPIYITDGLLHHACDVGFAPVDEDTE